MTEKATTGEPFNFNEMPARDYLEHNWEWTQSAYSAYPEFKATAGKASEYNGKFMVNQIVLRGASEATAAHHSRPSYRNFFYPDARWQFTSLRLARHPN